MQMKETHLDLLETYANRIGRCDKQMTQLKNEIAIAKSKLGTKIDSEISEELDAEELERQDKKQANELRLNYADVIKATKKKLAQERQIIYAHRNSQKKKWLNRIAVSKRMYDPNPITKNLHRQDRILEFAANHLKKAKTVKNQGITVFLDGTKYSSITIFWEA